MVDPIAWSWHHSAQVHFFFSVNLPFWIRIIHLKSVFDSLVWKFIYIIADYFSQYTFQKRNKHAMRKKLYKTNNGCKEFFSQSTKKCGKQKPCMAGSGLQSALFSGFVCKYHFLWLIMGKFFTYYIHVKMDTVDLRCFHSRKIHLTSWPPSLSNP